MNIETFWSLVDKSEPNDPTLGSPCWVWQGNQDGWGYGTLSLDGKAWRAHRLTWTLANGDIPPNKLICHKCDRPRCVNPEHLYIGTTAINNKDARDKGRWRKLHNLDAEEKEARKKYLELCRISSVKFN